MAVTQRPATKEAPTEPPREPLRKKVPSWFPIGEDDHIISAQLQRYMVERARAQRRAAIDDASHAISVSRPGATGPPIL